MASTSQELALKIIAQDGYYEDDPRAEQVITYDNAFGGRSWAILYPQDVKTNRYAPSHWIRNPQVLWRAS